MYEEKLVIALSRAYHVVFHEINKQLGANQLNLSQFGILETLYHKGELSVPVIRQKVLAFEGSIEDNMEYLLKKNVVSMKTSNVVSLTPKGQALMEELYPVHKAFLSTLFSSIPSDVQKTMVDELKQLYHLHK